MFNFKEKLNRFLDDLEDSETDKSNDTEEKIIESPQDFKAKQEELASYLETLKDEKKIEATAQVKSTIPEPEVLKPTIPAPSIKEREFRNTIQEKESPIIVNTVPTTNDISYFSEDLVINGDVITNDPLQIMGTINGNVQSTSKVVVNGNVTGNIKAYSAAINSSSISGTISCDDEVVISGNTHVTGDIYNSSIIVDGVVNGNIFSTERIKLSSQAEVYGNISAGTISMEEGSIIDGNIKMGRRNK